MDIKKLIENYCNNTCLDFEVESEYNEGEQEGAKLVLAGIKNKDSLNDMKNFAKGARDFLSDLNELLEKMENEEVFLETYAYEIKEGVLKDRIEDNRAS